MCAIGLGEETVPDNIVESETLESEPPIETNNEELVGMLLYNMVKPVPMEEQVSFQQIEEPLLPE